LISSLAIAGDGYGDYRRTVFVSGKDSSSLVAIDIDENAVTDRIDLGMVPRDMQVSQSGGRLVVSDGQSPLCDAEFG
jgi:DNA-binding beta-propeller fold protein YncE